MRVCFSSGEFEPGRREGAEPGLQTEDRKTEAQFVEGEGTAGVCTFHRIHVRPTWTLDPLQVTRVSPPIWPILHSERGACESQLLVHVNQGPSEPETAEKCLSLTRRDTSGLVQKLIRSDQTQKCFEVKKQRQSHPNSALEPRSTPQT